MHQTAKPSAKKLTLHCRACSHISPLTAATCDVKSTDEETIGFLCPLKDVNILDIPDCLTSYFVPLGR